MDNELDALLTTAARDDGTDPEFEELWSNLVHRDKPTPPPVKTAARTPAQRPPPPAPREPVRPLGRLPRVGTLVQRSSGEQAKKLAALLTTPPPPPRRRAKANIRPIRPVHHKSDISELFGDTLSDLSEDEHSTTSPANPPESQPGVVPQPTTAPPPQDKRTDSRRRPDPGPAPSPSQPPANTTGPEAPVYGPALPPPVQISLSKDVIISVPHFAAHVSRRYKARVGKRRFLLRFDNSGRCRYHREY